MLIRFKFKNFKSYREETTFLLTSNSKIRAKRDHVKVVGNKLNVLKFACLYGDNASGKTNILFGLEFFQKIIGYGLIPNTDFAFKGNENEPTKMALVFSIDDDIYEYGFSVIKSLNYGNKIKILDEHLDLIAKENKKATWIYRKEYGINPNLIKSKADKEFYDGLLKRYEMQNNGIDELLFLNYANRRDNFNNAEVSYVLNRVFNYIRNNIILIGSNNFNIRYVEDFQIEPINRLVKKFDNGIEDMRLEAISDQEVTSYLPNEALRDIQQAFFNGVTQHILINLNGNRFIFASTNQYGEILYKRLVFKHKYIEREFYFEEESEGTRRFITLMSYFSMNQDNLTFLIDEVERSMSPSSVTYLFKFCENESLTNNSQFIFSTHLTIFMEEFLRRDEIYFVDKDMYASSILYPLTEFVTRTDSNLKKSYLNGDFRVVSENKEFIA